VKRREFITLLGGAAAWPIAARAQQPSRPIRLGVLGPMLNSSPAIAQYQDLRTRLEALGFREGPNFTIDYQAVDDRRGAFVSAADLTRARPDLIVAIGPEVALQAVAGASGFVPVVMIAVNFDPLARGYVTSLTRPGGNITGLVFQQLELAQKQVELLTQAFPDRTRLAVLFDSQSADQFDAAERAATALNLQVQPIRLENPPYDIDGHLTAPYWAARRRCWFCPARCFCRTLHGSRRWRARIAYPPCSSPNTGPRRAGSWPTVLILR